MFASDFIQNRGLIIPIFRFWTSHLLFITTYDGELLKKPTRLKHWIDFNILQVLFGWKLQTIPILWICALSIRSQQFPPGWLYCHVIEWFAAEHMFIITKYGQTFVTRTWNCDGMCWWMNMNFKDYFENIACLFHS